MQDPQEPVNAAAQEGANQGAQGVADTANQVAEPVTPAVVAAETWIEGKVDALRTMVRDKVEVWFDVSNNSDSGWHNGQFFLCLQNSCEYWK